MLIACLLTAVSVLSQAQTNQGNLTLGVSSTLDLPSTLNWSGTGSSLISFGLTSENTRSDADGFEEETTKTSSINVVPRIGYFVADNFAVGLDLSFAYAVMKFEEDDEKYSQSVIAAGPFLRYYIPTSGILPFAEIGGSYGMIKTKYDYVDVDPIEFKNSLLSLGGGVGVAASLGEKASLDLMLGYTSMTLKRTEDNEDNDRVVYGSFGVKVGFTLYLGSN